MKTVWAVILNSIAFFGIWFLAAIITMLIAFRGPRGEDSVLSEYLRLGAIWFICPGIGGFYAPKVTTHFISEINIDSVIASFTTIISTVFVLLMGYSIFTYGTQYGGTVSEMVQLTLQFISMVVGTLMGKSAVKSNA